MDVSVRVRNCNTTVSFRRQSFSRPNETKASVKFKTINLTAKLRKSASSPPELGVSAESELARLEETMHQIPAGFGLGYGQSFHSKPFHFGRTGFVVRQQATHRQDLLRRHRPPAILENVSSN